MVHANESNSLSEPSVDMFNFTILLNTSVQPFTSLFEALASYKSKKNHKFRHAQAFSCMLQRALADYFVGIPQLRGGEVISRNLPKGKCRPRSTNFQGTRIPKSVGGEFSEFVGDASEEEVRLQLES